MAILVRAVGNSLSVRRPAISDVFLRPAKNARIDGRQPAHNCWSKILRCWRGVIHCQRRCRPDLSQFRSNPVFVLTRKSLVSSDSVAGRDAPDTGRPLLAIGLVSLAMLLFSINDGGGKYLTASFSAPQIIFVRYAVALALLLPLLMYRRGGLSGFLYTSRPMLQSLRGLLLAASSLLYTFALADLPLEVCAAIGFMAPLYVTALSIPLLGEKVGIHRWTAIFVGFASVLLILRPGTASFQWAMLLPLVSSLSWAVGLILTRMMRDTEAPLTVLTWSSMVGFIAAAPLAYTVWRVPDLGQWALLISVALCNAAAQYLVIRAFMLASASVLAPFSYTTMIWSILIGALVFNSLPDSTTFLGMAMLICAGLYVWHRERIRKTDPTVPGASIAEAVEPELIVEPELHVDPGSIDTPVDTQR